MVDVKVDGPIVRPITALDCLAFHRALDRVAREKQYLVLTSAPPLEATRRFVETLIADACPAVVAVSDGELIGWCDVSVETRPATAHSGHLGMGVVAEYRARGVGRALIAAALRLADARGLVRVELGVFAHNRRAHALYESVGFVEEGIRRRAVRIDGVYIDEIVMARLR